MTMVEVNRNDVVIEYRLATTFDDGTFYDGLLTVTKTKTNDQISDDMRFQK